MARTTIRGAVTGQLPTAAAPVIRVAPALGEAWAAAGTYLRLESAELRLGSDGEDVLRVMNAYGTFKLQEEADFSGSREALALHGWWVQLCLATESGLDVQFTGRIYSEERDVFGSDAETSGGDRVRRGLQSWSAFGPTREMRRRAVRQSLWLVDDEVKTIGWTPSFNEHDRRGHVIGNRCESALDGSEVGADELVGVHVFGGTETWTRRQALDYVLRVFAAFSGGPTWQVGGMVGLLDTPLEVVSLGATQTVYEVVAALLPRSVGIDWRVVAVHDEGALVGFEVRVFALLAEDVSFRGVTLPKNPWSVDVSVGTSQNLKSCRLSRDLSSNVSTVRLVGGRVVVCASLRATEHGTPPTLVEGWTAALETEYLRGDAETDEEESEVLHDAVRRREGFRAVYQRYAAPRPWTRGAALAPSLDGEGNVVEGVEHEAQDVDRSTLSWTPLREGFDYSVTPPRDSNPDGAAPSLLPPVVFGSDRVAEEEAEGVFDWIFGTTAHYTPVDTRGVGVSALKEDLGVQLHASPNHRLAAGRFDVDDTNTAVSDYDATLEESAIRAESLVATVAWRSDARLVLELTRPGGDGSEIEIEVEDAELYWLAPGTIFDVDGEGKLLAAEGGVLRNDADRLALRMAGLIARHLYPRARAELTFVQLRAWAGLLGHVLRAADEAGDVHQIQGPITRIQFFGGSGAQEPRTVVYGGYAG